VIASAEEQYRILLAVSEAANAHLSLDGVLAAVAGVLRPLVTVDAIGIATLDGPLLRPHATHIEGYPQLAGMPMHEAVAKALDLSREEYEARFGRPMAFEGSGTEAVGRSRRADTCTDLRELRRYPEDERLLNYGVRTYARTPLFAGGRLVGSITFCRLEPRVFGPDEVSLLEQISRPVAGAVANALAFEEIARLKNRLQEENLALQRDIDEHFMLDDIMGASPALRTVLAQIEKVAATPSTVLITGETGTGKELVARAVHRHSARAARPMIKANLAALPDSLIASELFGHERGAFTGAFQRRAGRFELASGGTLFLDEIGELPPEMQVALLRVLQEGEFERVGGTTTIKTDARVIAATNRDLERDVAAGRFRSDLFYRLNVFPIRVPPLRERREDVPILVEYFASRHGARLGRRFEAISRSVMAQLMAYDWPGNVRELQNLVERAAIISEGPLLRIVIPDTSQRPVPAAPSPTGDAAIQAPALAQPANVPRAAPVTLSEHESAAIEAALVACRGRISGPRGAATRLGVPASTLESRIRRLGIDKYKFKSPA
jgi:formate hydrogenlyase transcriptional activator